MPAVKFTCATETKANHENIKNLTYLAGGQVIREKVWRDAQQVWEAELEIISEGGTLYRQVKTLNLASKINLVN
jgi:hypothetical protein